jgi:hypothetical protein
MEDFFKKIMGKGLTKKDIREKRNKVLNSVEWTKTEQCTVSLKTVKQLVKEINKEFFNNLLDLPKVKLGYLIENESIVAFYHSINNTIYVNCKAINETSKLLEKFSSLNIDKQNLNLDLQDNILQAVCYVIEHELCHLVLFKYFPEVSKKEIAHGRTFIKLVKHLFGHNWGDFAVIHIGQYIESGFRKKKFFELLNHPPHNFDDEYREKVYSILWKATTLSNFYKLFFTK